MDSAMRLEAPANGVPHTCAGLRGSGSLLEISKPSDLEKQLTEGAGRGGSSLIKLHQRCHMPLRKKARRKKQGFLNQECPARKLVENLIKLNSSG